MADDPEPTCSHYRFGQPPCGSTKQVRRYAVGLLCSDCAPLGAVVIGNPAPLTTERKDRP